MDTIRIAIYDPVLEDMIPLLLPLLRHRSRERFAFIAFDRPDDLLACAGEFDLVFLFADTDAPDALAAAEKLSAHSSAPCVVLMAGDGRLALDAYRCALRYLCKPLEDSLVTEAVDAALKLLTLDRLCLKSEGAYHTVRVCDILCLTTEGNYVNFHTDKRVYRVRGCLRDFRKQLPADQFASCSQSTIVSLPHVVSANHERLTLSNQTEYAITKSKKTELIRKLQALRGRCSDHDARRPKISPASRKTLGQRPLDVDKRETEALSFPLLNPVEENAWLVLREAVERGQKLRKKMAGKRGGRQHKLVNAAVALLAVVGLTAAISSWADARWKPLIQFFVESHKMYSSINFVRPEEDCQTEPADTAARGEIFDPLADMVPEGYTLQEGKFLRDANRFATYINDSTGIISYDVQRASGTVNFDTENAVVYEEIVLHGHRAIFVEKNGYMIIWIDDETTTCHTLSANELTLDQFMRIAHALMDAETD